MNKKVLRWATVACFLCVSAAAKTDDFANVRPLFFPVSWPKWEGISITPLLRWVDTDTDGYPDKVKMAFNVWSAGTNAGTAHGFGDQTTKRTATTPVLPCTNPTWFDHDYKVAYLSGSVSVYMLLSLKGTCGEIGGETKVAHKTVLYDGYFGSSGSNFIRTWNGWEVIGARQHAGPPYCSTDCEFQLILRKNNASGDGSKMRVLFIQHSHNGVSGPVKADNTYDMEYFN
jgi:hypothetical protein